MLLDVIVMNVKMDILTLYLETVVKHVIVIQLEVLIPHVNVSADNATVNQVSQGKQKRNIFFL